MNFSIPIPFTQKKIAVRSGNFNEHWYSGKNLADFGTSSKKPESLPAVWACVNRICDSIACLPLFVYQRQGDSKIKKTAHPTALLIDRPNNRNTFFELISVLVRNCLLHGNGFLQIVRDQRGRVVELWPLPSELVTIETEESESVPGMVVPRYVVQPSRGEKIILPALSVVHLRGLTADGIRGVSPVAACRRVIETGLSMQTYSVKLFQQGTRIGGLLMYAGTLKPEARKNLRESWEKTYSGSVNAHKVAILEEGVTFKPVSMNQKDAQFVESSNCSIIDVCNMFNMPPHKIGHMDRSTHSNIEMQSIEFVQDTLMPWTTKIEQEFNSKLFITEEDYFTEFYYPSLVRGDLASRTEAYAKAIAGGWMTANDVRRAENMSPIPGGDKHLIPISDATRNANAQFGEARAVGLEAFASRLQMLLSNNAMPGDAEGAKRAIVDRCKPVFVDMVRAWIAQGTAGKVMHEIERTYIDTFGHRMAQRFMPMIQPDQFSKEDYSQSGVNNDIMLSEIERFFDFLDTRYRSQMRETMRKAVREFSEKQKPITVK